MARKKVITDNTKKSLYFALPIDSHKGLTISEVKILKFHADKNRRSMRAHVLCLLKEYCARMKKIERGGVVCQNMKD